MKNFLFLDSYIHLPQRDTKNTRKKTNAPDKYIKNEKGWLDILSMPFKIMLFVLVDGWNLIVESLVSGIRI